MVVFILNCGGIYFVSLTSFVLSFASCDESPTGREFAVANVSSNDPDHHLLMPIWAFKCAAVYLLFVSVVGSILNIIVVVVLLSDQQVMELNQRIIIFRRGNHFELILVGSQKMTPLNWMLLNLAFCDGIIAGFGSVLLRKLIH